MRVKRRAPLYPKLEELTWDKFEDTCRGELYAKDCGLVRMRLGLLMNMPLQVLIANGKVVRQRAVARYNMKMMRRIDITKPWNGLYRHDGPDRGLRWWPQRAYISPGLWTR